MNLFVHRSSISVRDWEFYGFRGELCPVGRLQGRCSVLWGLCRIRLQGDLRLAGRVCLNAGGDTFFRDVGIYLCESFGDPEADRMNLHINIEAGIGQLDEPGGNLDKCHTVMK